MEISARSVIESMTLCVIAPAIRFMAPLRSALFHGLCLFLGLSLLAIAGRSADLQLRLFDLPSESADKSLKRFSEQSGLEVIFSSQVAKGATTRPVKGRMAPTAALESMLVDTGLIAVQEEKSKAISVRPETEVEKNGARAAPKKSGDRPANQKTPASPAKP